MAILRALRPLVPHIVIVGGLAALNHILFESHYSVLDLVLNALLGFSWHAVAQIAVALPFLGVFYLLARYWSCGAGGSSENSCANWETNSRQSPLLRAVGRRCCCRGKRGYPPMSARDGPWAAF
jgi:hypothetical protein